MKKLFKMIFLLLCLCNHKIFAQLEVFDPTNWLSALDQVYQAYDQITKTITLIEQNYEQMAFYIDRARSFNFEEIEWDGDFDFRNEIFNATSQINKQLNNVRGVRDSFKKKNIRVGNKNYSFEDLVGLGDENATIEDFVKNSWNVIDSGFKKAADAFENGLTEEEAAMLWSKYGLTPANYYMVQAVKKNTDKAIANALMYIDEDVQSELDNDFYNTLQNIMSLLDSEGDNITETELGQISAFLQKQNITAIKELQYSLQQGISFEAWRYTLEKQEEQAKIETEKQIYTEMTQRIVDPFF